MRDVNLVCLNFFDRIDHAFLIERNNDDFLVDDFRIKNAALFGFLADVIPDIVIERGDRGGRAKRLKHVCPAADPRDDFRHAVIFDDIAADGLRRGAGGEQGGAQAH